MAALITVGVVALVVHPTCRPDEAGSNEAAYGVRHQKRGSQWFHCEPWIQRVIAR